MSVKPQSADTRERIVAAIDVGSNTIHIVVARLYPTTLDILADEVEMVRIGESVTATRTISQEKHDAAITTLRTYKELAERLSASSILVVATEAIRQASNSAEFVEDVRRETGLEIQIVTGDVEALLTFAGATYELLQEPHVPTRVGVMDLGGGSMELVTATYEEKGAHNSVEQMHITWRTSVPIGSGWLHDRYMSSNPPTNDELLNARTFLGTYLRGMHITHSLPTLTVTGGSANSLLHLSHHAFRRDLNNTHMTREDVVRCEGLLFALPAEEIATRYEQPVSRAQVLPSGALIIRTMMDVLQLERIQISPHGIREGVLLAYAQYGEHWLQAVNEQATDKQSSATKSARPYDARHELFVETGQRLLHERVQAMLAWRDDVIKDEDDEAVHKMRVASRRLRAVLDAYEPVCDPQAFQNIYRQVKKIAKLLGEVRDTDVMIQNLKQLTEHTSQDEQEGTRWLVKQLRAYRRKQQNRLQVFFKKFDERRFKEQSKACLSSERGENGES